MHTNDMTMEQAEQHFIDATEQLFETYLVRWHAADPAAVDAFYQASVSGSQGLRLTLCRTPSQLRTAVGVIDIASRKLMQTVAGFTVEAKTPLGTKH